MRRSGYEFVTKWLFNAGVSPAIATSAPMGERRGPVWAVRADPRQNGYMSMDSTNAEHPDTFDAVSYTHLLME